ncbi:hypothetical protein BC629DRAFT_1566144, partial [Irpex lacteus]
SKAQQVLQAEESEEEPLASKPFTRRKAMEVEVPLLSPEQRLLVKRKARTFVDDEASEDGRMETSSDEENDEDRAFIDDRAEEELEEESDDHALPEIPSPVTKTKKKVQAPVGKGKGRAAIESSDSDHDNIEERTPVKRRAKKPTVDSDDSSLEIIDKEEVIMSAGKGKDKASPSKKKPVPAKSAGGKKASTNKPVKDDDDDDDDVVLLEKPTSPTKRKGGVTVEQVPHKITMPAVPKKSMATLRSAPPLMDPKNNPFVVLDDDKKPAIEEQSPRKKARSNHIVSDEEEKETNVQDTPVTRISKRLKASNIKREETESEDSERELPKPKPTKKEVVKQSSKAGRKGKKPVKMEEEEEPEPAFDKQERKPKKPVKKEEDPQPMSDDQSEETAVKSEEEDVEEALPPPVEVVSNVNDPEQRKFMCYTLLDTYEGPGEPPVISYAREINTCFGSYGEDSNLLIMFRHAMRRVGIAENDPAFPILKQITVQAAFGRFLYNLARVHHTDIDVEITKTPKGYPQPIYRCLSNMIGFRAFDPKDPVAFTMWGTVLDSKLFTPVEIHTKDGRVLYQRYIVIIPLSMEFQRTMNTIANIWDEDVIGFSAGNFGLTFSTVPSPLNFDEGSAPRSPRKNRKPAARGQSEEPDLRLPSRSVGSKPIVGAKNPSVNTQDQIKALAAQGMSWTSAQVPIYDLTQAIRSDNPPACNQETLSGATEWIHGEIPDDSYVCLHYVPGQHDHGTGHKDVQFNLLRVVVMATPSK